MTTGTKSVLFGVHAFWWHPITVWLAWRRLYKRCPSFWECVAIFVHDLGYFGCDAMDDAKGERHPFFGAWAVWFLYMWAHSFTRDRRAALDRAEDLFFLVLRHSRYLSARGNCQPSDLCWADKLSMKFDPAWWYLLRARLSGELYEYRWQAREIVSLEWSNVFWFMWCRSKCARDAYEKRVAKPRNHATVTP